MMLIFKPDLEPRVRAVSVMINWKFHPSNIQSSNALCEVTSTPDSVQLLRGFHAEAKWEQG